MMKLVVLCCVVAVAAARAPSYITPLVPSTFSFGYSVPLQQPLYNYRGPLSLAPGQPANILAADGRPLDTLEVNLDRSAHFVAKALDNGSHALKKRSVTRLAVAPGPVGFSAAVAAGNVAISAPAVVGPVGVTSIATNPIGLSAPLAPGAFITRPFAAGPIGLSAPGTFAVSAGPLAVSTPVAAGSVVAAPAVTGTIGVSATGTSLVRYF